jgi:transposase
MEEVLRLREPNRKQMILQPTDIDGLIEADHPARAIWRVLEKMDLSRFCEGIRAREGIAGRDANHPRMLMALWLYAISQGVNSAREIERLCGVHAAYRWICGGISVNYHSLSDFRSAHHEALDELMSQVLAALMERGLISLERVAQDGTRVRASAGAASFRRKARLKACLKAAREHICRLAAEADSPEASARSQAAQKRAAAEREQRLEQALAQLKQLGQRRAQAKNHPQRSNPARASSTDPEARVMKMANGGFNPAYNVQLATDTDSRMIVGVRVTNSGSDSQQLQPMLAEIKRRTGQLPRQHLADSGYLNFSSIEQATAQGIELLVPLREHRDYVDPHQGQPRDGPAVADLRRRMGSDEGRQIYQTRAATAETVNADLRTRRGLGRLLLRGSGKVLIAALWSALTYNLVHAINLGWL